MPTEVDAELDKLEEIFLHQSVPQAQKEVLRLCEKKRLTRRQSLRLANIARKAWLPEKCIQLLNKIVRPPPRTRVTATEEERAEYAAALHLVGANREALGLLEEIPWEKYPSVLLFKAFALFRLWEFDAAVPILEKLVDHNDHSADRKGYPQSSSRLYLARGLMRGPGDHERAEECIAYALAHTARDRDRYLYAKALLFSAENETVRGNYEKARQWFERIAAECPDEGDYFNLQVKMWRAVWELRRSGPTDTALRQIWAARDSLRDFGNWELARFCHLQEAVVLEKEPLLIHLFYGSPYPAFRSKIVTQLGGEGAIPPTHEWHLGKGDIREHVKVDFETGENSLGSAGLKVGQVPQKLFFLLASDFFSRFRIAELFEAIHPEEIYHPETAPDRVHQGIRRLRQWFEGAGVPMDVVEAKGFYRLASDVSCSIVLRQEMLNKNWGKSDLDAKLAYFTSRIRKEIGERPFTSDDAAHVLEISNRSAVRYLKEARELRLVEQTGGGRGTRYKVRAA